MSTAYVAAMNERETYMRRMVPVSVLTFAALASACMNTARGAQGAAAAGPPADFSAAAVAEVKDAQGQVVLRGNFAVNEEADDDVERKATLAPTGVDADATGEAEVEVDRQGSPRRQEVEFSLKNLTPGASYTLLIDGKVFATIAADGAGAASHERDVPMPTTP